MQGSPQENPARKKFRPWGGVAFLVLTAAGVVAALHFRPADGRKESPLGLRKDTGARNSAENPASGPAFDMTQALGSAGPESVGLKPLDQLPPDLDFPPGSLRLSLVQIQQAGTLQTKADYFCPGPLEQVRELVRERILKLGWQEAPPASQAASSAGAVFYKQGKTLNLRCVPHGAGVKMIAVVTQESAPGPEHR